MGRAWEVAVASFPAFAYMFTVGAVGFWLPLFLEEAAGYTHSMTEAIATVYFASLAVGGITAGMATDETRKPHLVAFLGLSLNAAVIFLMPRLTAFHYMLVLRIVQGLSLSTAIPVALGSLSLLLGARRGVGFTALAMSTGMAVGSLYGGVVVEGLGYTPLFDTTALISLLAAAASTRLRVPGLRTRRPRVSELVKLVRGSVAVALAGIFGRQTLATGVYAILAVYLKLVLGLSVLETAVALTVNPVVQGFLSVPMSRLASRGYARTLYSTGISLTCCVFALLSLSTGKALIAYASMILQGIAFAMVNVSGNYIVITGLPEENRYTASSLFNLFFNLGWVAGTGLAGVALAYLNPLRWLEIAASGLLLLGLAVYIGFQAVNH
ncbi:MAG: MFS transporter [Desulfurococcales archaeon]|nr:MFS transporter [Desulfurococcales archaeon]